MSAAKSKEPDELATYAASKEVDDLLLELGLSLAGPGLARDGEPDDLRRRAQNWLDRNAKEIRARVCSREDLASLTDSAIDVATVADFLEGLAGRVGAYTVAAIILKRGLALYCDGF